MKQHTAIPRTNADTDGSSLSSDNTKSITTHLQAIAFTAGFHFASIEVGGTSLYPTLAQKVTNLGVLRILLSIGPSETMHFQTWQDKAGNALPITDTDTGFPGSTAATVSFADLTKVPRRNEPRVSPGRYFAGESDHPEPCHFLDPAWGPVAIIRPTSTKLNDVVAAIQGFMDDGLFIGEKDPAFLNMVFQLAEEADAARRGF